MHICEGMLIYSCHPNVWCILARAEKRQVEQYCRRTSTVDHGSGSEALQVYNCSMSTSESVTMGQLELAEWPVFLPVTCLLLLLPIYLLSDLMVQHNSV